MRTFVAGLALAMGGCGAAPAPPAPPVGVGPGFSMLTYNVNFERYDPATIDAIEAADADLVFLQETTAQWEAGMRARLSARYPFMEFRAHDPDGGMGVLAKVPVTPVSWLPSPVGRFPAWCLTVDSPLGPLRVLHVHLHPPLDERGLISGYFTTGGARRTEMVSHLGCFPDAPDLVVGDFNEEEGDAVELVEARGLRDAASTFPPVRRTWRWDTTFVELEGRPDHVYFGPGLAPRDVEVLETGASDHRPLRVVLQRRAP